MRRLGLVAESREALEDEPRREEPRWAAPIALDPQKAELSWNEAALCRRGAGNGIAQPEGRRIQQMFGDEAVPSFRWKPANREWSEARPRSHIERFAVRTFSEKKAYVGVEQSFDQSAHQLAGPVCRTWVTETSEPFPTEYPSGVHEHVCRPESAICNDAPIVEAPHSIETL